MRKSAIRIFVLVVTTTMLAGAAGITPAESRSQDRHVWKHRTHHGSGFGNGRPVNHAQRMIAPSGPSGDVCPGIGRSFECRIWPPPLRDDPDRKASGTDGG